MKTQIYDKMGNRPRCEILVQGDGESTKQFKERLNMFLDEVCTVDFSSVESVTSSMNDSRLVTTVLYVSTNEVMAPEFVEAESNFQKKLKEEMSKPKNKKS